MKLLKIILREIAGKKIRFQLYSVPPKFLFLEETVAHILKTFQQ